MSVHLCPLSNKAWIISIYVPFYLPPNSFVLSFLITFISSHLSLFLPSFINPWWLMQYLNLFPPVAAVPQFFFPIAQNLFLDVQGGQKLCVFQRLKGLIVPFLKIHMLVSNIKHIQNFRWHRGLLLIFKKLAYCPFKEHYHTLEQPVQGFRNSCRICIDTS